MHVQGTMRGFTPFVLLLAASVGITTAHVVNVQQHHRQHHGSRALSAVSEAKDVDMFYRRLDPDPGQCCGMCTQIMLNPVVVVLLIAVGTENGGELNPIILGNTDVTIVIRLTLLYTDNLGDPNVQLSLVFDVVVEPEDWNQTPCSYLQEDCIVFQNDEILMFAPDAPGGFTTLSIEALNQFTANSNINIISNTCDVRCQVGSDCGDIQDSTGANLASGGVGTLFGIPTQSTFNNGFCDPSIFDDPHVTGLRGQRYDWSGEDGGWYAFLSTQDQLQMNLRVTSHLPATFPERQLVTGVALVTEGGHTITVDIVDPLDLAPTCQQTADAVSAGSTSAPCLVNGGLRVTVDGQEEVPGAGEHHFDGGIHITAVNLPLECQRFGDYLMWGDLGEEQKLMHAGRKLRSTNTVTSIFEWLLADSVMIAPPWCVKYLEELDGDMTALAGVQSNHAVLRIESPNLSLRVNVGINSEQEQTLEDGRVVPTASFWQMDVRVEDAKDIAIAKGML
ncbi:unnamed protein product, partial [Laminaria digitata]